MNLIVAENAYSNLFERLWVSGQPNKEIIAYAKKRDLESRF